MVTSHDLSCPDSRCDRVSSQLVIDEKTLEEIVRAVIQRIIREHPELVTRSSYDDNVREHPELVTRSHDDDDDNVHEHLGRVLSEDILLVCRKRGKYAIRTSRGTILTPLARDRARDLGIDILFRD